LSGAQAADAPDEALARAAAAGIRCMGIPTPFLVGRVNTYLIEDDPLTLVDSGPNSGKALDELERALARLGRRVEDIELVLITHQHIDHTGLVEIVARRSGAEVAALDLLAPYLSAYVEQAEADDEFAVTLMRRHGIAEDTVQALRSVSQAFRGWGGRAEIGRPLAAGSELRLRDRTLEVLHRPGHSPSDTIFWDAERRIVIGGDHLIAHISSNPLVTRPLPGTGDAEPSGAASARERPRALMEYLDSLRATREMPVEIVLAGHGAPVTQHVSLIDERLALHDRRARRILRVLAERPSTAHEVAQRLWGNVAVTQAYLTLSEVLGHVDLLLADGRAVELESDGVVRFSAAAGRETDGGVDR